MGSHFVVRWTDFASTVCTTATATRDARRGADPPRLARAGSEGPSMARQSCSACGARKASSSTWGEKNAAGAAHIPRVDWSWTKTPTNKNEDIFGGFLAFPVSTTPSTAQEAMVGGGVLVGGDSNGRRLSENGDTPCDHFRGKTFLVGKDSSIMSVHFVNPRWQSPCRSPNTRGLKG